GPGRPERSRRARSMPRPRDERRFELRCVEHRPVDAEADVARAGGDDAAEARAIAAGHPRLERELGGDVTLGAQGTYRLQHRRRATRVDGGALAGVELLAQELGHEG